MLPGKSFVSFGGTLLLILCCVHISQQQVCIRPNLNPYVIITPDKASYTVWEFYEPSCPEEYRLSGRDDPVFCTDNYDGSDLYWNPSPSTTSCLAPCFKPNYTDPDVTLTPDQDRYYENDGAIPISCLSGSLSGYNTLSCSSDGIWDPDPGPDSSSCLSDCTAPANTNGTNGTYPHTSAVNFACNAGYGDTSVITLVCNDGAWSPQLICELQGCAEPILPADVTITNIPDDYDVHTKVTLACNGDKTLSGADYSYCSETGKWDPDPMEIKCYDMCRVPSFDDSRVIHSSDRTQTSGAPFYDHTDTLRFSCDEGIFVDGPWRSVCNDGTWSPSIGRYRPVCKNNCTAPPNMSNAGEQFRHSFGHTFECDGTPGMVRMGGPRSVCMDGVWKPRIRCDLKKNLRSEL